MLKEDVLAAREELGLSRAQFAARLGVVRTTVMRWEKGEVEVPRPAELGIAHLLTQHRGSDAPHESRALAS